ncbi:hypothetical protein P152DRAFT_447419 [Eremomyces bilateralis CBS 781.70]|uniref:RING-type E3 ubiquitin transferase n=1 Tax=Eremomyces bilateralis CBS 781.70 TaxID=1392243 RepID=A0A6G1GB11_9PEZI|nr:uncharacterized protein P152DRAFT_447419 [Eremomyces bilateralis CBS 781.70]KAF1815172.1 hypothetical protein P152DRAFT_447419 [Eremomyces bilateralis CBS 781.70]
MAQGKPSYRYPFSAAPDIIRANQKDAYFQGVLFEQVSDIVRKLYGARTTHNYTSESRAFADLLYLGLTTVVGNRTLGEEYSDIVQIEGDSRVLPSIERRLGYVLSTVLLPYSLNRILPALRRRLRSGLEKSIRKSAQGQSPKPSALTHLKSYLLSNLDTITSPSPVYAISLAVFYFTGAYYQLGKRVFGLRYIFTRHIDTNTQRVGYEVLGVLLVLQLSVQTWLHVQNTVTESAPEFSNVGRQPGDHGVEVSLDPTAYSSNNALLFEADGAPATTNTYQQSLQRITQTPVLQDARFDLEDTDTMQWIKGKQQRKCTLCLESMRDPSVTTCGHMFCWTCIGDWCREKPECPLCRQTCLAQHVLPLRG